MRMAGTEQARFAYRGFEVFTRLVKFDMRGWTARYSIFFADEDAYNGPIAHGGEIRVSSCHIDPALAAARSAARLWIDVRVSEERE